MRQMIHQSVICLFVLVGLSAKAYSAEPRNYWTECFSAGKKSQEEFNKYVDTLSVEEVLILGRQAAEECQRKLKDATSDGRAEVENEYLLALGLVLGRFTQRAGTADKARLFTEPISDLKSPLFWRKALIHMTLELQEEDPEAVRSKDYKLVSILGDITKSASEDAELRKQACRVAGLLLQRELKKPPKSEKEKQILTARITENVKLCRELLKDRSALGPLADIVEETLRQYKDAGISEDQESK